MNNLFFIPLLAFAITAILHLCALRDFPRLGLLDFPERYGYTRGRIPYPTGIIAVLVFVGCFASIAPWTAQTAGILLSVILLAFVSFRDDRNPLPWWVRLLIQVAIAFLVFATGTRIYTLTNPLEGFLGFGDVFKLDTIDIPTALFGPLPLLSGIFTIVWLFITMNALNWFDGIPGQVSVLSTLGFFTIGALSLSDRVNQPELAVIAFLLAGISGACLIFDFPPNKVLMGDTGAMFFGFMLGVLTIYAGGKVATAFLVLGVPLIDFGIVILRRMLKRTPLSKGNTQNEHLHHRLRSKGWNDRQIIFLTSCIGTAFGMTALFLSTNGKMIAALLLFGLMIGLSFYTHSPKSHG